MRNIWKIINMDAHRIFSSVVVLVVLMGLCVVPCLYSWFNVFSNWDPYGQPSTSRVRVAVASKDRGADLLGVSLEVGEQLIEGLEANKQIGWVFCDTEDEALELVYSGDCYAALIVPESFSQDIVSFMTLKFEHPKLQYYENGKKNAIAPKITGKAKTAVQEQVNTTFLQTFANGASTVVSALDANGIDAETALEDLSNKLIDLSMEMDNVEAMLDSLSSLSLAAGNLMNASARLTKSVGGTAYLIGDASTDFGDNASSDRQSVSELVQGMQELAEQTNAILETLKDPNNWLSATSDVDSIVQQLNEMAATAESIGATDMAQQLGNLSEQLETSGVLPSSEVVESVISDLQNLNESLASAVTRMGSNINEGLAKIAGAAGNIADIMQNFGGTMDRATSELSHLATVMVNVDSRIQDAKRKLDEARDKMLELADFLDALSQSEFLKDAIEVLSTGGDLLDSHIASPLKVSDEVLYPSEPYGSQMSPFYTVLAQYVGALFCACLLKTGIREQDRPEKLRMIQHYIGRYVLFLCCGLLQAVITVAGVLLYCDIDCLHPWYFAFAGLATSVCFVTINYVLSFTLGSAGLGASVIIMVVQVAGAGGTYPVEVLPKVFRILYPFMPFKFAMNAMREALSGFYGSYYHDNVRTLFLIAAGSLLAGLVIYYPGKLINDLLEKSKKATGVMI